MREAREVSTKKELAEIVAEQLVYDTGDESSDDESSDDESSDEE